jgi:hypothetical protein
MSPLRLYLAAPLASASRMKSAAEHFRIAGWTVTSTWHDTADSPFDPNDESMRSDIWLTNRSDLNLANAVYLDTTHGVPRCALVELGIAIDAGKRICWMQRPDRSDRNMADMHPGVKVVTKWSAVLPTLHAFALELAESPSSPRLRQPSIPPCDASGHFRLAADLANAPRKAGTR